VALTLRDKTLLDMAANNATPEMIAEKTGFPVAKVALELDRDWETVYRFTRNDGDIRR